MNVSRLEKLLREEMLYQDEHQRRRYVRSLCASAIRRGVLVRQPCEQCGSSGQFNGREGVHAHHDDYSKPFEVRWLCHFHHVSGPLALKAAAYASSVRRRHEEIVLLAGENPFAGWGARQYERVADLFQRTVGEAWTPTLVAPPRRPYLCHRLAPLRVLEDRVRPGAAVTPPRLPGGAA
jgi:hypothetical protein